MSGFWPGYWDEYHREGPAENTMPLQQALERLPQQGVIYTFYDQESKTRPGSDRWICIAAIRHGERVMILDVDTALSKKAAQEVCAKFGVERRWERTPAAEEKTR